MCKPIHVTQLPMDAMRFLRELAGRETPPIYSEAGITRWAALKWAVANGYDPSKRRKGRAGGP